MRILRVSFAKQIFYASLQGNTVSCLIPQPSIPETLPLEQVDILPVVSSSKIVCIGLNYRKHVEKLNMAIPANPSFFLKPPSAIIGPGHSILIPPDIGRVDHEAELALVIGHTAYRIAPEEISAYLFGYT
jgi:2-keto-4-pentenoate hydratase/2-oxohepta-3-ene-1,7-dioic acid hydratase in catechol pathway